MSTMAVPVFSMAERDRRWGLARGFMDLEGLDALLVFGEHEDAGPASAAYDRWFTNGRAGTRVIFPRAGEPVALLPSVQYVLDHLESSRRGDSVWIPPEDLRASRDSGPSPTRSTSSGGPKAPSASSAWGRTSRGTRKA